MSVLDEWNNFLERINCKRLSEVWENEENVLQLRHWVSLRGQTLYRTGSRDLLMQPPSSPFFFLVMLFKCINLNLASDYHFSVRGMMYYRRALKLQAFLDMADTHGNDD